MALQIPSNIEAVSNIDEELELANMPEVDEYLMDEGAEEELDVMKLLMEPPLPKAIALGKIVEDGFGFYKKILHTELGNEPKYIADDIVRRYTMINDKKLIVQVINYGATITALAYPDREGNISDVLMGFDNMDGYLSDDNPKFGAALGRYSEVITDAVGKIGGNEFFLSENRGFDHVFGGVFGFDKVLWHSYVDRDKVVMTYTSADKEEGYPGVLQAQITFKLTSTNQLIVQVSATTSKPTPLSVGHHLYVNLGGHGTGLETIKQHVLTVNADRWMLKDPDTNKYTGELQNVGATYFDLRVPRPVAKILSRVPGGGYDTTFSLTKGLSKRDITFASRLAHPETGRYMEIHTDYPSLHITTCNHLPNPDNIWGLLEDDKNKKTDLLDFLCKNKGEEGDWMWPQKVMSTMDYPRPLSIPEEEHLFKRFSELSLTEKSTEESDKIESELLALRTTQSKLVNEGTLGEETENLEVELEGGSEEEDEEGPIAPSPILGKGNNEYKYHGAISFIAEEYPDPFLFKRHPRPFVYPGQPYTRTTIYKFGCVPPKLVEPLTVPPRV